MKAFEAFAAYRDMGSERSTRKVARHLGKSTALINRWSSDKSWVARVSKYDEYLIEEERKLNEKERFDMRKRHASLATQLLAKAAKALLKLPEEEIKASDIARMVDTGVKIERLSRGESTENVDGKVEVTGKDGGPIESKVVFYIPDNGRDQK